MIELKSSSSIEQVEISFEVQEFSDSVDEREEVEEEPLLLVDKRFGASADDNECDEHGTPDAEDNDKGGEVPETCAPA